MGRLGSVVAGCCRVLSWAVILGVAAVVTVAVVVPRVGGATPYSVLTGSMRPSMPPGTMVVVRPKPVEDIRVGDVVTYQLRSGEPAVVTHRVIGIGLDGAGRRIFRTQGDANDTPDAAWVRAVQVKGARWYAVPHLGRVSNLLNGAQRQVVLTLVISVLLAYAVSMFASDARDRWRRRRTVRQPAVSVLGVPAGVSRG